MFNQIFYYIGRAFEFKNKWRIAIFFYQKAYTDFDAKINYRLGFSYKKIKDFGNAIYYLKKAIKVNKNKIHWYYQISDSYLELNKEEDAAKYLNKGIILSSNNTKYQKKFKQLINKFNIGIPHIVHFISGFKIVDNEKILIEVKGYTSENNINSMELIVKDENSQSYSFDTKNILLNNNIYTAQFIIDINKLFRNNNQISNSYKFEIHLLDKINKLYYYEKDKKLKVGKYGLITISKNKFLKLIVIRHLTENNKKDAKHIILTLGNINSKTNTTQIVINLANALAKLKYNITLVALDFNGKTNKIPISKQINFDYVFCSILEEHKSNISFYTKKDSLSEVFIDKIYDFFSDIKCDILYMPIFRPSIFNSILNSISSEISTVVSDFSARRYRIYDTLLQNKKDISINNLISLTKDKHFFENIDYIDAIHFINPIPEKLFKQISNKKIFTIPHIYNIGNDLLKNESKKKKIIIFDKSNINYITSLIKLIEIYPEWEIEIYTNKIFTQTIKNLSFKSIVDFQKNREKLLLDSLIFIELNRNDIFGENLLKSIEYKNLTISIKESLFARYFIDNEKTGFLVEANEKMILLTLTKVLYMFKNDYGKILKIQEDAYKKLYQFSSENVAKGWEKNISNLLDNVQLKK